MESCQNLLLDAYIQGVDPYGFLASFFKVPSKAMRSMTRGAAGKISVPLMFNGEEIAIPQLCCGATTGNVISKTDVMELTVPKYSEEYTIDDCDLYNAPFGINEYDAAMIADIERIFNYGSMGLIRMGNSHNRAIELQAAQIWQTGSLSLTDQNADQVYTYDFPKEDSNFPTTAKAWDNPLTCDPRADITALVTAIKTNGSCNPDIMIMNSVTFDKFLKADKIRSESDLLRVNNIMIEQDKESPRDGRVLQGTFSAGGSILTIYTYDKTYKDPATGNKTKYINDDKVIILDSSSRFDIVPTHVPRFKSSRNPYSDRMPSTLPLHKIPNGIQVNPWLSGNNRVLHIETYQNTVLIPTALNDYGCLTTA